MKVYAQKSSFGLEAVIAVGKLEAEILVIGFKKV